MPNGIEIFFSPRNYNKRREAKRKAWTKLQGRKKVLIASYSFFFFFFVFHAGYRGSSISQSPFRQMSVLRSVAQTKRKFKSVPVKISRAPRTHPIAH